MRALATGFFVLLAILSAASALGADESFASYANWFDRTDDALIQQAFLPSARNVHGEFRLIERHGATCAQTLLYTRSLRRALQRMGKKERRAWPEGQPGHDDSIRYLEALDAVRPTVLPAAGSTSGELQTMAIEFVLDDNDAFFAIFALDIDSTGERITVENLRPLIVQEASRHYVERAIDLMTESAFDDDADKENECPPQSDR